MKSGMGMVCWVGRHHGEFARKDGEYAILLGIVLIMEALGTPILILIQHLPVQRTGIGSILLTISTHKMLVSFEKANGLSACIAQDVGT